MSNETTRRKQFLFVDDDASFLEGIRDLFNTMSGGSWQIFTAENHAQGLALLAKQRVDVAVLDIGMAVMDGIQFLKLLGRTHPGQQVVMLTGDPSEENRKASLENGAVLFLEKPADRKGFEAVFAALDALANAQPQSGFRGMMRRVGLQDVLQMECLNRKSSILEIFTAKARGRIFIFEGTIIHAESGALTGELALFGLLALQGGEFNFQPFTEPPQRSISGHWESLLMEAARLSDEGSAALEESGGDSAGDTAVVTALPPPLPAAPPPLPGTAFFAKSVAADGAAQVKINEILLCSGSGDVLYEWRCPGLERRLRLMEQLQQHATEVSKLASVGRLDRVEILTSHDRIVCQIVQNRRVLVRSSKAKTHQP